MVDGDSRSRWRLHTLQFVSLFSLSLLLLLSGGSCRHWKFDGRLPAVRPQMNCDRESFGIVSGDFGKKKHPLINCYGAVDVFVVAVS